MYSFNEVFRSLADWFGVPSNIVVVDYPEGCESKEFNILRERLPSAYFIKCGKCIKDGGVFSSPKMLLDTIEEARKHALKDAFMIFTYTDTDSLHISGDNARKLTEKGYIVTKENSKLGYLCSDIDDEGIIVKEINLGPKCYFYEYLTNDNVFHEKGFDALSLLGIYDERHLEWTRNNS